MFYRNKLPNNSYHKKDMLLNSINLRSLSDCLLVLIF